MSPHECRYQQDVQKELTGDKNARMSAVLSANSSYLKDLKPLLRIGEQPRNARVFIICLLMMHVIVSTMWHLGLICWSHVLNITTTNTYIFEHICVCETQWIRKDLQKAAHFLPYCDILSSSIHLIDSYSNEFIEFNSLKKLLKKTI